MCRFHYNATVEKKKQLEALHSYVRVTTNSCENGATANLQDDAEGVGGQKN